MPPRKAAAVKVEIPIQPTVDASEQNENIPEEVRQSLARWTDEQEIALLKGIVKWKPVGMHKHFRMIAIHNYMIGQGVVSPDDEHTTIPGLWTKLGSLYNLPVLDEREDAILQSSSDENGSSAGEQQKQQQHYYCPYDLPEPEYEAMKFDKRLNLAGSKSPSLLGSRRGSTVADTDEPASSPAPGRRGYEGRGAPRRTGRVSKLQQEAVSGGGGLSSRGGSSRRTSKAASATENETMADHAGEDEQEGGAAPAEENEEASSDPDNGDNESGDVSKAGKPARSSRATADRRGGRGRGGTRSRGRRG